MKTLRLQLPVLDLHEADELLDLVTAVDGVIAALVDEPAATLEVVVAHDASALHVREQLMGAFAGAASA